jgi:hypothetical protein
VRLVRFGAETSAIGADVRAALASWGASDTVLGGFALLGVTPLGCPRPVEAVIVVPKGVVVVVGVDLPDPAVRLDAPLDAQWKADGWPLVREDGAVNPAGEALAAASAVTSVLAAHRVAPIPVSTIVAVGPYVGQVVQSTTDLHHGVRVLHPEPKSMLAALRELAVAQRPCSVDQAGQLLAELVGDQSPMLVGEIAAEGFADTVTSDLASASTTLLPKITDRATLSRRPRGGGPRGRWRSIRPRWLPMAALGLLVVVAAAVVGVAVGTAGGGTPARAADRPRGSLGPKQIVESGIAFRPRGAATATDCAGNAYGDVQVWLAKNACTTMVRSVYQTSAGGRPAAVALAVVTFADEATATAFGTEARTPGNGGITDLVADGERWQGAPASFDNAAYTVTVRGAEVRLTEVVWATGTSSPADPALRRLAAVSAALPGSQ